MASGLDVFGVAKGGGQRTMSVRRLIGRWHRNFFVSVFRPLVLLGMISAAASAGSWHVCNHACGGQNEGGLDA